MTSLKYNTASYKRLAEIAGWLASGENVQISRTGDQANEFGGHWMSFCAWHGNIQLLIGYGY